MSEAPSQKTPNARSKHLRSRLLRSRFLSWLANLPPIAKLTDVLLRAKLIKPQVDRAPGPPKIKAERIAAIGLEATLQGITEDVVEALGYVGAMMATYKAGDTLPVRAFYVDPDIATLEKIRQWEAQITKIAGEPISITDPGIARVYVNWEKYKDNLSVKAAKAKEPVISDELYDLFTPIAPLASRAAVKSIQKALGIQQVIAVPFFLKTFTGDESNLELVGNLFAAKGGKISERDTSILQAFARQAAAAIETERQRLQIEAAQALVFSMQAGMQDEDYILGQIAKGVVSDLGYAGAMVATYEMDGSLPARALYVAPNIATKEQIRRWEDRISGFAGEQVSITDPDIARVFMHKDEYKDNLSVKAAQAQEPVVSDELYDLFTPIAPPASKSAVLGIQQALDIKQVIAVPFFLGTLTDGKPGQELIGNLFAATRSRSFTSGEIGLLKTFGQQAAAGIRNARLYRKAEERRQTAEIFGTMAFSAAASVHTLRNHIGAFRGHFELLGMEQLAPELRKQLLAYNPRIHARLEEAADILDKLHKPWRRTADNRLVDVNFYLDRAIDEIIVDRNAIQTLENIQVQVELSDDLPQVKTSPDMLTEALKVLIRNALEAIRKKGQGGKLEIKSCLDDDSFIKVSIRDTGTGIRPENVSKIYEMRWISKKEGLGFGLFWTKDYIEGIGGSISVQSEWEEGTTFQVSLPAEQVGTT